MVLRQFICIAESDKINLVSLTWHTVTRTREYRDMFYSYLSPNRLTSILIR